MNARLIFVEFGFARVRVRGADTTDAIFSMFVFTMAAIAKIGRIRICKHLRDAPALRRARRGIRRKHGPVKYHRLDSLCLLRLRRPLECIHLGLRYRFPYHDDTTKSPFSGGVFERDPGYRTRL
jgi:hypothetical protein